MSADLVIQALLGYQEVVEKVQEAEASQTGITPMERATIALNLSRELFGKEFFTESDILEDTHRIRVEAPGLVNVSFFAGDRDSMDLNGLLVFQQSCAFCGLAREQYLFQFSERSGHLQGLGRFFKLCREDPLILGPGFNHGHDCPLQGLEARTVYPKNFKARGLHFTVKESFIEYHWLSRKARVYHFRVLQSEDRKLETVPLIIWSFIKNRWVGVKSHEYKTVAEALIDLVSLERR